MTPEEAKALVDGACDLVAEVTAIGGIAALAAGGAQRVAWLKKFVDLIVRHGGKRR